MEEGDVLLSDREPGNTVGLGSIGGKSQICPRGFWEDSSRKVMWLTAQLKSPYTNTCSVGNKQEKLEAMAQLENYHLIVTTETSWDKLHRSR